MIATSCELTTRSFFNHTNLFTMIIDTLANADKYKNTHPLFAKAFAYIKSQQLDTLEPGKYPVEGTDIHASVSSKDGLKAADAKFEAHNNYIDIQVCISATEQMGWKPRSDCKSPTAAYDTAKDVIF